MRGCGSNKGKIIIIEKVKIVLLEIICLHQCMVCNNNYYHYELFCVALTDTLCKLCVCTLCIGLVHESDCSIHKYSLHAHAPMKLGSQSSSFW